MISAALLLAPCLLVGAPDATQTSSTSFSLAFLGPPRAVDRQRSASRDVAAFSVEAAPRVAFAGGAEFSFLQLGWGAATARVGVSAMLELEKEGRTRTILPVPGAEGAVVWRRRFGLSLTTSLDELGPRWLGDGGALELGLMAMHEAEHTAGNDGEQAVQKYAGVPHIGDEISPDVAARFLALGLTWTLRYQHRWFIPGRSAYRHGPAADVIASLPLAKNVELFNALFAEYVVGGDTSSTYSIRNHLGVALMSSVGELQLLLMAEVGRGKGLLVIREESTLGFGIRLGLL